MTHFDDKIGCDIDGRPIFISLDAPAHVPATNRRRQGPVRTGDIGPMLARQTALLSLSALVFAPVSVRH